MHWGQISELVLGHTAKAYLGLDQLPFLANPSSEQTPHVSSDFHVCLRQNVQLHTVPLLGVHPLHQPLMTLSARIWRFVGEVFGSDLVPVEALCPGLDESLVVLRRP